MLPFGTSLVFILAPLRQSSIKTGESPDENMRMPGSVRPFGGPFCGRGRRLVLLLLACGGLSAFGRATGGEAKDLAALEKQLGGLKEQGKYAEAIPAAQRILALTEEIQGSNSWQTARCLNELGSLHRSLSHFEAAAALYERALVINEKALGSAHPETATTIFNLASLYQSQGDYAKAETNLLRAVTLGEQAWGPGHANTAEALRCLGLLYLDTGRYPQAESALQRGLAIAEKREDTEPLAATGILNNLARLYKRMGDYPRSETVSLTVLRKQEKFFGTNHINLAGTLNGLGLLYREIGDFDRAEAALTRALELKEQNLSPTDRSLALGLANLAALYQDKGDFARAEAMYQRDLAISEKVLGENHPETLISVNNLASLYAAIHDYARAEPLFWRVLQARETNAPTNATSVADVLNNLAGVYHKTGKYDQAGPLYERALQIRETTFGTNHAATAQSLHNLGMLYARRNEFDRAAPLVERALGIQENIFGRNHPAVANSLENLADIEQHRGNLTLAEAHLDRALDIYTNLFGPDHPDVARCLTALARLKIETGQTKEAHDVALRAGEAQEKALANILSFTSERQRLAYQRQADPCSLAGTLGDAELAAKTVLRNKGIVLDSLLEDRLIATSTNNPHNLELSRDLRLAKQRLAQLLLVAPRDRASETLKRRAAEKETLTAQVEQIEAIFARQFAGLGRTRRALTVDVEQVQREIPRGAILVEMLRYLHYARTNQAEQHYGAVVLAQSGPPRWYDLGPATDIEKNVRLFQSLMRGGSDEAALSAVLHALHQQVWLPIERGFPRGIRTVILSPDGELNFVSFATLLDSANQFLAKSYSIRYVASGRDLLPGEPKANHSHSVAIYANPDFGASLEVAATSQPPPSSMRGAETHGFRDMKLNPLPGAEKEAEALQAKSVDFGLKPISLFIGKAATKSALYHMASPYVLHLATHGFFLPEPDDAATSWRSGVEGEGLLAASPRLPNPMQRSGLALAGARRTFAAWVIGRTTMTSNDGIVTAEEVGGLDLHNSWLVVVSACDTGLGEARAGEGVLGLRRGFLQAGAENVVLTLWPIDDEQTIRLITDFYACAFRTGDPPRALAEVQRKWLSKLSTGKGLLEACRTAGPFILSFRPLGQP